MVNIHFIVFTTVQTKEKIAINIDNVTTVSEARYGKGACTRISTVSGQCFDVIEPFEFCGIKIGNRKETRYEV